MSVFLGSGVVERLKMLNDEKTDLFGDQLTPFMGNISDSEYCNCFI
jgi:hypothetical protein